MHTLHALTKSSLLSSVGVASNSFANEGRMVPEEGVVNDILIGQATYTERRLKCDNCESLVLAIRISVRKSCSLSRPSTNSPVFNGFDAFEHGRFVVWTHVAVHLGIVVHHHCLCTSVWHRRELERRSMCRRVHQLSTMRNHMPMEDEWWDVHPQRQYSDSFN